MLHSPDENSNGGAYPWVYYLLGAKNEQYSVYHGIEISDDYYKYGNNSVCFNGGNKVYLYPVEYNVFGAGGQPMLSYKIDENGQWHKYFKIYDHLGNVVAVQSDKPGNPIEEEHYYLPYGNISASWGKESRTSYIDKEKDAESQDNNFGVRQYGSDIGRFLSPEPLWEKFYFVSPYAYCNNNPISAKDDNGNVAFIANGLSNYWTDCGFSPNIFTTSVTLNNLQIEETEKVLNSYTITWDDKGSSEYAPNVSEFLENHFVPVIIFANSTNSVLGQQQGCVIGINENVKESPKSTFFHELIHLMPGKNGEHNFEFQAYAASYSMGYESKDDILARANGSYFQEGIPANFLNKYYKKQGKSYTLDKSKSKEFLKELFNYGMTITGAAL